MTTYYFQLGNTPKLSLAELGQLLPVKPEKIGFGLAQAELDNNFDPQTLQKKAGGIVKTLKELIVINNLSRENLQAVVINQLLKLQPDNSRLTFSLTYFQQNFQPQLSLSHIKKKLQPQVGSVRYLQSEPEGLSAAVLLHQNVTELALFTVKDRLVLAQTTSVQDIDDWTKRDRRKPYADHQKGMLPPKVARMMVNLAKGHLPTNFSAQTPTLYDPFCGSGAILMEALLREFAVQGSDLDQAAVKGTQENLNWLKEEYQIQAKAKVLQRDATQGFNPQTTTWANAIVTEPFLGKQTPKDSELPNIFKGLYRTYLGAMKSWRQILKPGAPVIIITPVVEAKNTTYRLQRLIDNWSDLGYTTISQPLEYSRAGARVKRQINLLNYGTR